MKICIYGAGSIGGLLGAHLAHSGHDVSLIARGAHLEAIRRSGLHLTGASGDVTVKPAASDDPADFGPQDYVILAVKAPALPGAVAGMAPLLGDDTCVVAAMNGIPWWFCDGVGGALDGRQLRSVDPDGTLAGTIAPARNLGCVIHGGASVPEPGRVRHAAGGLFLFGEPDHRPSERARALTEAVDATPLAGKLVDDIHYEIWMKLIGNMGMGPISVLTSTTLEEIAGDPDLRTLSAAMMNEGMAVGEALGLRMEMSAEERIDLGAELGAFKPSILQDLERGRPLEID
ncbi:MAG: 2-dehydropantoate 2-reductase, partial [Alphaproteobacteria bacterium]